MAPERVSEVAGGLLLPWDDEIGVPTRGFAGVTARSGSRLALRSRKIAIRNRGIALFQPRIASLEEEIMVSAARRQAGGGPRRGSRGRGTASWAPRTAKDQGAKDQGEDQGASQVGYVLSPSAARGQALLAIQAWTAMPRAMFSWWRSPSFSASLSAASA